MKSLFRIFVILLCLALPVSAGSSPAIRVAEAIRKTLKAKAGTQSAQELAEIIPTLSVNQRKGLIILMRSAVRNAALRQVGGHDFLASDLNRVMHVVNNLSNYPNKTLPKFLDDIKDFDDAARAAGDADSLKAIDETLLGLGNKISVTGAHSYQFNSVKGKAAEIIEIATLKRRGINVIKIQPMIDTRAFREAYCGGPYASAGKTLLGNFYLEVKNYPSCPKELGKKSLKAQVETHFSRLAEHAPEQVVSTNPNNWPGLLYRFAKAGPNDDHFRAYKIAIETQIKRQVIEQLRRNGISDNVEIADKVKEYVKNKVVIELVE